VKTAITYPTTVGLGMKSQPKVLTKSNERAGL
jgi:hypothetical protein